MVSLHGLTLIKSSVVKGFLFMDVLPARTDASSLTATFKVFLTRVSLVERDQQIINTENIFLRQHK